MTSTTTNATPATTASKNGVPPKTVLLPQGTIAYRDLGSGPALLFVHGLLVDGRLWDGVAERLSTRGFRCIVPDWPMGSHRQAMNADADLSPTGQVEVIAAFMEALGLERATIVGNDTGGAVSQMLAAAHPERVERLILTNCDTYEHFPPFPFSLLPMIARLPGGTTALQAPFRIGAVARMTYNLLVKQPIDPALVEEWLEAGLRDAGVKRDLAKILTGVDKRKLIEADEQLRSFERPVRFIWATADRFFKLSHAERLAATLPDAEITEVADAGTFVPLDQPQRVAELIAEFTAAPSPA